MEMSEETRHFIEGVKKAIRDKRIVMEGVRTGKTIEEMEKEGVVFYNVKNLLDKNAH